MSPKKPSFRLYYSYLDSIGLVHTRKTESENINELLPLYLTIDGNKSSDILSYQRDSDCETYCLIASY